MLWPKISFHRVVEFWFNLYLLLLLLFSYQPMATNYVFDRFFFTIKSKRFREFCKPPTLYPQILINPQYSSGFGLYGLGSGIWSSCTGISVVKFRSHLFSAVMQSQQPKIMALLDWYVMLCSFLSSFCLILFS